MSAGSLRPMAIYLAKRIGQGIVVVLIVILFNFLLIRLAPGDVVDVLGATADMSAEQMAQMRAEYGLDNSAIVQFGKYLWNLLTFDLGYSPSNFGPVLDIILQRLPVTLALVIASLVVSMTLGTLLGVISAMRAGSFTDAALSVLMLLIYATPPFIVAILLILVFSVALNWLPVSGLRTITRDMTGLAAIWDMALHLLMPVAALSAFYTSIYGRLSRASMLDVLGADFVRSARAKGIPERQVVIRHALRNSLLPIITMAGLQVSALLGGAVLIETVFGLPGMGRTAFDAVMSRDTNMLLGVLFVCSIGVLLVSLFIDLIYVAIDPRVELQ